MVTRRRTSISSSSVIFETTRPPTRTSPSSGRRKPRMCFRVTLLPTPLRPSTTTISPRRTSKLTSSSTFWSSKDFETCANSMYPTRSGFVSRATIFWSGANEGYSPNRVFVVSRRIHVIKDTRWESLARDLRPLDHLAKNARVEPGDLILPALEAGLDGRPRSATIHRREGLEPPVPGLGRRDVRAPSPRLRGHVAQAR